MKDEGNSQVFPTMGLRKIINNCHFVGLFCGRAQYERLNGMCGLWLEVGSFKYFAMASVIES
jgi:hypothetical protein